MDLDRERTRPLACATSKRLVQVERCAADEPVQDSMPGSIDGNNELSSIGAGVLTEATEASALNASQFAASRYASESAVSLRLRHAHAIGGLVSPGRGSAGMYDVQPCAGALEGDKGDVLLSNAVDAAAGYESNVRRLGNCPCLGESASMS